MLLIISKLQKKRKSKNKRETIEERKVTETRILLYTLHANTRAENERMTKILKLESWLIVRMHVYQLLIEKWIRLLNI